MNYLRAKPFVFRTPTKHKGFRTTSQSELRRTNCLFWPRTKERMWQAIKNNLKRYPTFFSEDIFEHFFENVRKKYFFFNTFKTKWAKKPNKNNIKIRWVEKKTKESQNATKNCYKRYPTFSSENMQQKYIFFEHTQFDMVELFVKRREFLMVSWFLSHCDMT